jgi:hypothetical protein
MATNGDDLDSRGLVSPLYAPSRFKAAADALELTELPNGET